MSYSTGHLPLPNHAYHSTTEDQMLTPQSNDPMIPQKIQGTPNRPLEPADINVVFRDPGPWWLYYALLISSGLKCTELALLLHGHIDRAQSAIVRPHRRPGRWQAIPIVPDLMREIPVGRSPDAPLFPGLFTDIEDREVFEEELNDRLDGPLGYMQALLSVADRPIASLHSLTLTHHNLIMNRDLFAKDQLIKLAQLARQIIQARSPYALN